MENIAAHRGLSRGLIHRSLVAEAGARGASHLQVDLPVELEPRVGPDHFPGQVVALAAHHSTAGEHISSTQCPGLLPLQSRTAPYGERIRIIRPWWYLIFYTFIPFSFLQATSTTKFERLSHKPRLTFSPRALSMGSLKPLHGKSWTLEIKQPAGEFKTLWQRNHTQCSFS